MNLHPYYEEYEQLSANLMNPDNLGDHTKLKELNQRQSYLEPIILAGRRYEELGRQIEQTKTIISSEDPQLSELGREELEELEAEYQELGKHLKVLLIPPDPFDERDVIIEIRPGAGGEESALFAAELLLMYVRFSERHRWSIEVISETLTESGGYKEIIFRIKGSGVYGKLKFESGVHRVQRVPKTESQGRIHTSTVTVAVLPEADEVDVEIQDSDLRIDVFRSGGHGGQSVNTTDSAVRITHLPTGLVVTCQDEKSQLKNKLKAMSVLRARLLALEQERRQREASAQRKSQIGTGDRSEKIRTYNFPQNRVTDHRINLTLHSLQKVLDGELDELIEALALAAQAEGLAGPAQ